MGTRQRFQKTPPPPSNTDKRARRETAFPILYAQLFFSPYRNLSASNSSRERTKVFQQNRFCLAGGSLDGDGFPWFQGADFRTKIYIYICILMVILEFFSETEGSGLKG